MSSETIALIIFSASSLGLGGMIVRKIPTLSALPKTIKGDKGESLFLKIGGGIKKIFPFKDFSYEAFLEKVLTKVRILSLRTDNKTSTLLQKLRENAQKKKIKEDGNYWEKIKREAKKTDF